MKKAKNKQKSKSNKINHKTQTDKFLEEIQVSVVAIFKQLAFLSLIFNFLTFFAFHASYAEQYKIPLTLYADNIWLFSFIFFGLFMTYSLLSILLVIIFDFCIKNKEKGLFRGIVVINAMYLSVSFLYLFFDFGYPNIVVICMVLFLLLLPFVLIYYYIKYKNLNITDKDNLAFFIALLIVLPFVSISYIFAIDYALSKSWSNLSWMGFSWFAIIVLSVVYYVILVYFRTKERAPLFLSTILLVMFMVATYPLLKGVYVKVFHNILINNHIATESNAILYFNKENKKVLGQVIFQSSSYALIEYHKDEKTKERVTLSLNDFKILKENSKE